MRTFVAITTPPSGRVPAFLDECRRRLDADHPDVKWVAAPHRHITLRFLGDMADDSLAHIKSAVLTAAQERAPFEARLAGWGAFPGSFRPQTLWAAVSAEGDALQRLESALTRELWTIGVPPEGKPFHPHITLGRVRSSGGLDSLARTLKSPCPPADDVAFAVDRITLFESVLSPAGPKYTILLEAPLGSAPNLEP